MSGDQKSLAVQNTENAVAADVHEGIQRALVAHAPNQFAMVFEQTDENGKKTVTPYVKKAGRSVVLNEVAKKKGGLALIKTVCVRHSKETGETLLQVLAALDEKRKAAFLESRLHDFRCFTLPPGYSLYRTIILFKSGEKWEGEGIAYPGNIKTSKLLPRQDELAETRSFMRCVGRGTADGFISPEQAAGSADYDAAEAELLAEEAAMEEDDSIELSPEVTPEGDLRFRSPDSGGTGGTVQGEAGPVGAQASDPQEASGGRGDSTEPDSPGNERGQRTIRPDSGEDSAEQAPSVNVLMAKAREKGVYLIKFVKDRYRCSSPGQLTPEQRWAVLADLVNIDHEESGTDD